MLKTKVLDGETMYCLRYQYTCPRFEQSLLEAAYVGLGQTIYGRDELCIVDDEGRQWITEGLKSENLAEHFIRNPAHYLHLTQKRVRDFAKVAKFISDVNKYCETNNSDELSFVIQKLGEAAILSLMHIHMAQLIVEIVVDEFSDLIKQVLPLREANIYLTSIFEAPAAAEAVKLGFTEDTRGTKRLEAVKSPPVVIFSSTKFPNFVAMDSAIASKILHSEHRLDRFWALRVIAPLAVQLAEEFRYADYSTRTHFKFFFAKIRTLCPDIQEPNDFSWHDLVEKLRSQRLTA